MKKEKNNSIKYFLKQSINERVYNIFTTRLKQIQSGKILLVLI